MKQSGTALEKMLDQYATPESDIAKAYMRSFSKGGPIDIPSYQELYGSYRDVAEREAGRQSAAISESLGARGARYGSDMLGAQSRLRENLFQDLTEKSGTLLTGLRKQQFDEAGALVNYDFGRKEAGMARLFQDFLRRTGEPKGLQDAAAGASGGDPTTVV